MRHDTQYKFHVITKMAYQVAVQVISSDRISHPLHGNVTHYYYSRYCDIFCLIDWQLLALFRDYQLSVIIKRGVVYTFTRDYSFAMGLVVMMVSSLILHEECPWLLYHIYHISYLSYHIIYHIYHITLIISYIIFIISYLSYLSYHIIFIISYLSYHIISY